MQILYQIYIILNFLYRKVQTYIIKNNKKVCWPRLGGLGARRWSIARLAPSAFCNLINHKTTILIHDPDYSNKLPYPYNTQLSK